MRTVFSYISLFLLIFDLALPGLGRIGSAPISALISSIFIMGWGASPILSSSEIYKAKFFIKFYLLILTIVAIRLLFSNFSDISFFLASLKSTVICFSALLYIFAFIDEKTGGKIINVFVANAIICLTAGSIPSILSVVYKFKIGNPDPGFIPYRDAFLSGSGYYGIAAPYSIVIVFSIIYYISYRKLNFLAYLKLMLMTMAGILAARTMFVGIGVAAIYSGYKRPKFLALFGASILVAIFLLTSFEKTAQFSNWFLEIFLSDSATTTGTESTDRLAEMYFIPGESTIFWGDAKYSKGEMYYMRTDAGYMRQMLYGGLPLLLLILMIPILLGFIAKNKMFTFFLIPLTYMLHIKGNFIYNSPSGMPLLILIAFWIAVTEEVAERRCVK